MSKVQKVNLIDEQKNTKEIIQVSTVGSYEFENTELTGFWVDSDTGNLEVCIKDQPQLTIPKSIADLLDEELNPLERESMIETFVLGVNYLVLSDELMKFVITGNNYHIICAYLAGKALGVDLVKVVEG
ncbi:hypothetical protein ACVVIB_00165 [Lactococcus lactis]